jgi:GNAT superfamily N-acetyltransferase
MGGRWAWWDDAWAADSALPTRLFNRVTVLRRVDPSAAPELSERIIRFFGAQPGGGEYLVNDPWATLDLEPYGFSRWRTLPFMVRPPGGTAGRRPDVEIREVRSKSDVELFVRALVEGFAIPVITDLPASAVMDERILVDGAMRCWVAFADGRPVGTSVAYLSDGIVGVYLVAVVPRMRRQGVGEALTRRATLTDPTAPSTLQASALGQALYERMGYVTALDCATWIKTIREDAL